MATQRYLSSRTAVWIVTLLVIAPATALWPSSASAGGSKVEICHIPPGNPENFHTIAVNQNAVAAHLENHGDLLGPCCDPLGCDDQNPCTQDSCEIGACLNSVVDCDDGDACTVDMCDSGQGGCVNTLLDCADGDACTADVCVGGACENPLLSPLPAECTGLCAQGEDYVPGGPFFTKCGTSSWGELPCYCDVDSDGVPRCVDQRQCSTMPKCANGCPEGTFCIPTSYCVNNPRCFSPCLNPTLQ